VCGEWCKLHWLLLDTPTFDWNTHRSRRHKIFKMAPTKQQGPKRKIFGKVQSFSDTLYCWDVLYCRWSLNVWRQYAVAEPLNCSRDDSVRSFWTPSPPPRLISSYDAVQTSLSEKRYRSITDILASQIAEGSYKTFNLCSVERHQAIHNNAAHTPAKPVTFIHQIIQLSKIPIFLLPTIKRQNHHRRVYSTFQVE
jgi:hypothetical protein